MQTSIRVSSGTAGVLGLLKGRLDAPPTTAYLMVGGRCRRTCGFCAQANNSKASAAALSRVNWPSWSEDQVLSALEEAYLRGRIERCCLQVTVSPGYLQRVKEIATGICKQIPLGASVVGDVDQVGELLEAGLDRVGLSLDVVNEESYQRIKGGDLSAALSVLEEAAHRYPGRIVTHLVAGLGESEEDVARMMARLQNWGVTTALFAFTPIAGTAMAGELPPPVDSYRRIQIAQYLLVQGLTTVEDFAFSRQGRIVSYGLPDYELRQILSDGKAFETSGCPGCNRPYYNEPPSGPLYNYPHSLTHDEAQRALDAALSGPL